MTFVYSPGDCFAMAMEAQDYSANLLKPGVSCREVAKARARRLRQKGEAALVAAVIEAVGSLRRGCDTCGDLDLLATGAP